MWSIEQIESLGFKLRSNDSLWCRFIGHGYDVSINLNPKYTKGNYFNFKSLPDRFKGNFSIIIYNEEEFNFLLNILDRKR